MRLSKTEQAVYGLLAMRKGRDITALSQLLSCSEKHVLNVLAGVRGLSPSDAERLRRALGSPFTGGPSLDPSQLEWLEQVMFAPFVGHRRARPVSPPRSKVVIDRLVITASNVDRRGLFLRWPVLMTPPHHHDRKQTIERSEVIDGEDDPIRIGLERSEIDLNKPCRRKLRYRHSASVYDCRDGNASNRLPLIAILSVGRFRAYCGEHRPARGGHREMRCDAGVRGTRCPPDHFELIWPSPVRCGRCRFPDRLFRKCARCRDLNHCSECDRLTSARPDFRFEVTGKGFAGGFLEPLLREFVVPFVAADSVAVREIHIALDVELPFQEIIPFQRTRLPGTGFVREVRANWDVDARAAGMTFGSPAKQLVVYDKLAEVEHRRWFAADADRSFAPPDHTEGWQDVTRFEFRFRPQHLGTTASPVDLFENLPRLWSSFGIADLRLVDAMTPSAMLLALAKQHGFTSRQPSVMRARKLDEPCDATVLRSMKWSVGDVLLRDLRRGRCREHIAEERARVLNAVIGRELTRLDEQSPIDIGSAVDRALPVLRRMLVRALRPRARPRSQLGWTTPAAPPASRRRPGTTA